MSELEKRPVIAVLAPIGTSPPVITEFIQYVEEALGERVTHLAVISTNDPYVLCCTDLAEQAIKDKYPHVRFHRHVIGFEDIDTQDRLGIFMLSMAHLLKQQVRENNANKVYVNAAGGRKDAVITLSMLCQFLNIPIAGVFHIIMPEVKAFNVELERAKNLIEEFGKLNTPEEKEEHYRRNWHRFRPLMYPPLDRYSVIKIPVVPFPLDILQKLAKILSETKTLINKAGLDTVYLRMLADIGIIRMDSTYIYPTDEGRFLWSLIEAVWHPFSLP